MTEAEPVFALNSPRRIALAVLGTLLVIFILQNFSVVEVNFLIWSFSLPRSLVYILMFAAGLGFDRALMLWRGNG